MVFHIRINILIFLLLTALFPISVIAAGSYNEPATTTISIHNSGNNITYSTARHGRGTFQQYNSTNNPYYSRPRVTIIQHHPKVIVVHKSHPVSRVHVNRGHGQVTGNTRTRRHTNNLSQQRRRSKIKFYSPHPGNGIYSGNSARSGSYIQYKSNAHNVTGSFNNSYPVKPLSGYQYNVTPSFNNSNSVNTYNRYQFYPYQAGHQTYSRGNHFNNHTVRKSHHGNNNVNHGHHVRQQCLGDCSKR